MYGLSLNSFLEKKKVFSAGTQSKEGDTMKQRGSLTVETALILPLFLAVVLTLASFLPMIKNQEEIESSVLEAGKWASEADYFYEKWGQRSDLAGKDPGRALCRWISREQPRGRQAWLLWPGMQGR